MYRYRKFTLGDGSVMMVRTEGRGAQNRGGKKQLLQAYAINEWCAAGESLACEAGELCRRGEGV